MPASGITSAKAHALQDGSESEDFPLPRHGNSWPSWIRWQDRHRRCLREALTRRPVRQFFFGMETILYGHSVTLGVHGLPLTPPYSGIEAGRPANSAVGQSGGRRLRRHFAPAIGGQSVDNEDADEDVRERPHGVEGHPPDRTDRHDRTGEDPDPSAEL